MKEKLKEIWHSKELRYVLAGFALLLLLTNPGRLEIDDFAAESGFPSQDKYYNLVFFTVGNEWGTSERYVHKESGGFGYEINSHRHRYIGILYTFFIVTENSKTHEKHFQFISKP